jgi:hypothetical protein
MHHRTGMGVAQKRSSTPSSGALEPFEARCDSFKCRGYWKRVRTNYVARPGTAFVEASAATGREHTQTQSRAGTLSTPLPFVVGQLSGERDDTLGIDLAPSTTHEPKYFDPRGSVALRCYHCSLV